MKIEAFLDRLTHLRSRGMDKWSARCPAHDDRSPSLSVNAADNKILIHCFSGCAPQEIVVAMGLTLANLFTDSPESQNSQSILTRRKLDLTDVAFHFELGALDRRLRAERVLTTAKRFHPDEMNDQQLERTLNAIAGAYTDCDRAEFLETVADRIRTKAYQERTIRYAA